LTLLVSPIWFEDHSALKDTRPNTKILSNRTVPLKDILHELLVAGQLEQIGDMAVRQKRVLGSLVALTFDTDPLICWRAIEAMGIATARIAEQDAAYVREHLRRLYWLLSEESGGVCWRAPEAMAEIASRQPTLFADYIPIVVSLIVNLAKEDLQHFRGGALWAIGRLGSVAGDHLPPVLAAVTAALDDTDPQIRGMAAWCLGRVGQARILAGRPHLLTDEGSVDLYEGRLLTRTSVGRLVRRVLNDGPEDRGAL
jgi:HEAT repeat protein